MLEEWLIDGYNLLHHGGSSKSIQAKTQLLSQLASFAASKKTKIWMVLDGTGASGELGIHKTHYFEPVYAENLTADQYIEKYLYQYRAAFSLVVVTNDRAIANMARGGGARVMSNQQFMEILLDSQQDQQKTLDQESIRAHGFHRPFDQKLKEKGF